MHFYQLTLLAVLFHKSCWNWHVFIERLTWSDWHAFIEGLTWIELKRPYWRATKQWHWPPIFFTLSGPKGRELKSFPENFIPPQEPLRSPLISSVGAKNSLGHKETKGEPNTAQIFLLLQNHFPLVQALPSCSQGTQSVVRSQVHPDLQPVVRPSLCTELKLYPDRPSGTKDCIDVRETASKVRRSES